MRNSTRIGGSSRDRPLYLNLCGCLASSRILLDTVQTHTRTAYMAHKPFPPCALHNEPGTGPGGQPGRSSKSRRQACHHWVSISMPAPRVLCIITALCLLASISHASVFQFHQQREVTSKKGAVHQRDVLLWIPAQAAQVRGIIVGNVTLAERDIAIDPRIRAVCKEQGLASCSAKPAWWSAGDPGPLCHHQ